MAERSFNRSTAARTIGNLSSNGNRLRDQSPALPLESMTAIARKPSSFVSKINEEHQPHRSRYWFSEIV